MDLLLKNLFAKFFCTLKATALELNPDIICALNLKCWIKIMGGGGKIMGGGGGGKNMDYGWCTNRMNANVLAPPMPLQFSV